nr:disintegrin and metalloproteinase domain-containing protein 18 [Meriones unguiculatus]
MPLLFLLAEFAILLARLDSEGIYLHITVPRRIEPHKGGDSEGKVTYIITVDGKPYSLHLRNYSFISPNFLVYTRNETGSLYFDSSRFMTHCHYRGYVEESPNSTVTLSTCSGLRGFLQLENISYGIESLESSARFEHIVYQVKSHHPASAENDSRIWQTGQLHKDHFDAQDKNYSQLLPQSLKLHIIVEKSLYDYMGSDIKAVSQKIFQIIGLVNTMFTQLELTVMLASLELWSDRNQIPTDGDANDILQRLLGWRQDHHIRQSPHEITHLLIYRKHPKYIGAASPSELCNESSSVGIGMYPEDLGLEGFSVVIAQLIGLQIGLTYDDVNNCSCPRAPCIMQQEALSSSGMKTFSNCSVHDYRRYASNFEVKCVGNLSNVQVLQLNHSVCGDGIVEANEECDCGNDTECRFRECCNSETCRLKASAQCGSGPCCTPSCEICEASEHVSVAQSRLWDVLCGKLTCFRPNKNQKSSARAVMYTYVHDSVCLSVPLGLSTRADGGDNAYVADGTVCGPQMYCINRTCQEVNLAANDCNATKKCKGNGICNNFGNCQCFPDYRPPDCNFQIGSPGGSIDDGNILRAGSGLAKKHVGKHEDSWLILGFFIFLPFLITLIIGIMKRNERKIMPQTEQQI